MLRSRRFVYKKALNPSLFRMYRIASTMIGPQYHNLSRVLRNVEAEKRCGVSLRELGPAEFKELHELRRRLAHAVGAPLPELSRAPLVLDAPLSEAARAALEQLLLPEYGKAIDLDERVRESFLFEDCGEPLVDLAVRLRGTPWRVAWSKVPYSAACGSHAGKDRLFWVRRSVADRFVKLVQALNAIDLVPQVEDCFRPREVQEGLFRRRVRAVRDEHPTWTELEIHTEVSAKTAIAPYRAAHMAGAAIDFTLLDDEEQSLPLGNIYPLGGAAAVLEFPYLTWEEFRTRVLFETASLVAGLFPYPGEDWHVSFGDGLAAIQAGITVVQFCAVRSFDPGSGKVELYSNEEARAGFAFEEIS